MTESSAYLQLAQDEKSVPVVDELSAPAHTKTLDDLAKMGKYAFLVMLFSEFVLLQGAGNMVFMIFGGAAPTVSCVGENYTIPNICARGISPDQLVNCHQIVDYEFKSVNVEFELYCKDGAEVKRSISIQMTGVLLGTVVCGMLSDMFGRLRIISLSFLFSSILGIACAFPPNMLWFTVLRSLQGPFTGGLIGFVYESPRWLIGHGRLGEAREILDKIQARDGEDEERRMEIQKLLDVEYQAQHARDKKKKKINVFQLFSNKKMSFYMGVISLGVFITAMTNYALAFNLDKLSGSIFINSLSLGIIRWSINISCGLFDYRFKWLGRKTVHVICQGLTGASIGVISVVYILGWEEDYRTITRVATIAATSLSTQVFITKSVVTMEIFPTLLRNQAVSFKSIFSRLGIIAAPFVFLLSTRHVVPYTILAVSILLDSLMFQCSMPETKGASLPEKMQDEEKKREPLIKQTV